VTTHFGKVSPPVIYPSHRKAAFPNGKLPFQPRSFLSHWEAALPTRNMLFSSGSYLPYLETNLDTGGSCPPQSQPGICSYHLGFDLPTWRLPFPLGSCPTHWELRSCPSHWDAAIPTEKLSSAQDLSYNVFLCLQNLFWNWFFKNSPLKPKNFQMVLTTQFWTLATPARFQRSVVPYFWLFMVYPRGILWVQQQVSSYPTNGD
jgi:hypothetical protein